MAKALYFAAVTAAAIALIHGKLLASPGFKAIPKGPACFAQPFALDYTFLPPILNDINCVLNTLFIAIKDAPNVSPLLGIFGSVFVPTTLIVLYDSFRPGTRHIARLATPFILLGQLVTAGVALPLYYTIYTTTSNGKGSPSPVHAWTALIATVFGMLIPSMWMEASGWGYAALSVWQPFPVYMFVLSLLLPSIIRGFGPRSIAPPVTISALLGIGISVNQHVKLFTSGVPIIKALLPAYEGLGLGPAGHALFAADCAFVTLTMSSIVALRGGSLGKVLFIVVATLLAGPGAGIASVWAWNELKSGSKKAE